MMQRCWVTVLLAAVLSGSASLASAQDTHLLIVTGVSGDEALAAQYRKWAATIVETSKKRGIADANITYLSESPDQDRSKARATRAAVTEAFTDLAGRAKADDEVVVVLIGHGSFNGREAAFNLPGPDLAVPEFGALLDKLTQRVAFVNTTGSSGEFLKLTGPNRIIVTATKTGGERNDTRFPEFFVEALTTDAADRDRNGRISVLEAFDYAKTKVAAAFEQGKHILTEHATLDDGKAGKLAETVYLTPRRTRDEATASAAAADPQLASLLAEQDVLERRIAELRAKKDAMEAPDYERQLEQLLTDLALKTRAIREREGKK